MQKHPKQAATCIAQFRRSSERIACSASVFVCLLAFYQLCQVTVHQCCTWTKRNHGLFTRKSSNYPIPIHSIPLSPCLCKSASLTTNTRRSSASWLPISMIARKVASMFGLYRILRLQHSRTHVPPRYGLQDSKIEHEPAPQHQAYQVCFDCTSLGWKMFLSDFPLQDVTERYNKTNKVLDMDPFLAPPWFWLFPSAPCPESTGTTRI